MNKVMLIGFLGRDPETRMFPSGSSVCTFSVASNRTWKNAAGEKQEETTWFRISAWGKLGDVCQTYLKKGQQVYVEGRAKVSAYIDKNGNPVGVLEIVAEQVLFLGTNYANVVSEPDIVDGTNTDSYEIPF